VCSEHITSKVMICTYWWWLSVTGEREIEKDKHSEPVRSVQWDESRKTQKYSDKRHCVKPVWTSFWWNSRRAGQNQFMKWTFSTGFQWCYVSSNAGNLRLPEEISDSLWAGRSGDRIPVEARFFARVRTGPGAHPTSCRMRTGSYPGVKAAGVYGSPPNPSSDEIMKE
jgi:hypothetical protein